VEGYLVEVLNGRSGAAIDELISDRTLKQRVVAFRSAFPDVVVEARQVLAEDALVAVDLIGSGRHEGLFQGCPPTGRRWTTSCTAIYRIERGRIADSWTNWDLLALIGTARVRSARPESERMKGGVMQHKRLTAVAMAVTVGAAGVGTAIATPGSGILAAPVLARGTLEADQSRYQHKRQSRSRSGCRGRVTSPSSR
jgi:predicted ester cyclase